jgi:uncharacterized protein (TIGR02001 family)
VASGPYGRWIARLATAAACATLAPSTHAQLSGNVGLDSDYRYRGVPLSGSRPSPRATLNYDASDRWYVGASLTRAALIPTETYVQGSGYAGWATQAVNGWSLEAGVEETHFAGVHGYDFTEAYAGVLADRWSARLYYAPDYYGRRTEVAYAEFNAFPPFDRTLRLFGHVGALVPLAGASGDAAKARFDASAGAGLTFGRWDLHMAAVAATRHGPYPSVHSGRPWALVVGTFVAF